MIVPTLLLALFLNIPNMPADFRAPADTVRAPKPAPSPSAQRGKPNPPPPPPPAPNLAPKGKPVNQPPELRRRKPPELDFRVIH